MKSNISAVWLWLNCTSQNLSFPLYQELFTRLYALQIVPRICFKSVYSKFFRWTSLKVALRKMEFTIVLY